MGMSLDDDDYLPDFLKEDSVVESPFGLEAEEPYDEPASCGNCDWYGMSSELVWGKNPRIIKKTGKSYSKPQCPKCSYSSWFWSNEEPAWLQAESKKLPPVEKAIDTGIASGATMEGLETLLAAEEGIYEVITQQQVDDEMICEGCPHIFKVGDSYAKDGDLSFCVTCAKDFKTCIDCDELYDPEGEHKWAKTCSDCRGSGFIMTSYTSATYDDPAEADGDDCGACDGLGYVCEEGEGYGAETLLAAEEFSKEDLEAYFADLKKNNPKLAKIIEFKVKNEEYLPKKLIESSGYDYEILNEWYDYVIDDDKYALFDPCPACEGEGWIMTSYTPATRFEPADGDGEDCGECGGSGKIDPSDYMYYDDKGEIEYAAETKISKIFPKSMNPYLLGAGIFALTLGILSRKL